MDPKLTLEERTRALDVCKNHLGGAWREVPLSKVKICRLSGGMSNLLYRCALPNQYPYNIKTVGGEPKQILLRIYGPSYSDTEVQLKIFNQLASENLGPKLFATFEGGRLEEYLPAGPLKLTEMTDDEVSAIVACKIAAIHKLEVQSLHKSSQWLIEKFDTYYTFIKLNSLPRFEVGTLESTKNIALGLLAIDFKPEIEYLASLLRASKAPLVFSHNDLHQNNILLMEDPDKDLNDRIVLIDFEYCSYNYRTFDIANHLSEWCFDYNGEEYPYFSASLERFPSERKQRQFLEQYVLHARNSDLSGDHPMNLRDQIDILFNEMQPFLMASNMLWTLWAIRSGYTSRINFGYWEMARYKWDIYLLCKKNFQNRSAVNHGCEPHLNVQSSKM